MDWGRKCTIRIKMGNKHGRGSSKFRSNKSGWKLTVFKPYFIGFKQRFEHVLKGFLNRRYQFRYFYHRQKPLINCRLSALFIHCEFVKSANKMTLNLCIKMLKKCTFFCLKTSLFDHFKIVVIKKGCFLKLTMLI